MAGAEIRRYSYDRHGVRLNFVLGLGSGALLMLVDTLLSPLLILPLFVSQLTTANRVIGLVPAIAVAAWLMARLPSAAIAQGRRLPWVSAAAMVQTAALALLAYVSYQATSPGDSLLRAFLTCYLAYSVAAGLASVPATDILVRAMPPDRRMIFFRLRTLAGVALGVLAGLVAGRLLASGTPDFPRDYALLFVAAAAGLAAATFCTASLREPLYRGQPRPAMAESLRSVPRVLADQSLRRFLVFRAVLSLSTLADPFFIVYAVRELAIAPAAAGGYVVVIVLVRFATEPVWAALAARRGDKAVLQYAALVRLVAPLVAVLLPYLVETGVYRDRVGDERVTAILFGMVFAAYGASLSGQIAGNFAYVQAITPGPLRSAATAVINAVLAVVALAPVAGGILADRSGYATLLVAAVIVGFLAVLVSGALTDTFVSTRAAASAWRLRAAERAPLNVRPSDGRLR